MAGAPTSGLTYGVLLGNVVTVKDTVTKAMFKDSGYTAPTLAFTAYAVQSAGVADAATAWGYTTNP